MLFNDSADSADSAFIVVHQLQSACLADNSATFGAQVRLAHEMFVQEMPEFVNVADKLDPVLANCIVSANIFLPDTVSSSTPLLCTYFPSSSAIVVFSCSDVTYCYM